MSTSNVPAIVFSETGLVLPSDADILTGVQSDIDAAFGGGVNPALETPQGQIASSEAAIIADKNAQIAYVINQFDPNTADGIWQDALARFYFIDRKPATSTVVTATLGGISGTSIPQGTLAKDTSGEIYLSLSAAVIRDSGTVDVDFANQNTGPIPCPTGTLTQVYQAIPGWDTITNASAGILGSVVESRADFEYRRRNSVAMNSSGTPPAIYATVFDVDNVLDVYVIDNSTNATVNTGSTNYPLEAHSVYVAVVGGIDADVAKAIWTKKDLGCSYNGNTTVNVVDDSGYSYPYPTYAVKFQRPAALPIKFEVQITSLASTPSNIEQLIKDAIISRFNGADGTARERIGSIILASRYYSAITSISDNVSLLSVLIGTSTPTLTQVQVGIDQRPTLTASDITVVVV